MQYLDERCYAVQGIELSPLEFDAPPKIKRERDIPNAIYSLRDNIDWDRIERENKQYRRKVR